MPVFSIPPQPGQGDGSVTVAAIRAALAGASNADKFDIMAKLHAREELYVESSASTKPRNAWTNIQFNRALTHADNDKFLYIRFTNVRRQAEARVRIGRFLALTPMNPLDNEFDHRAIALPFYSGDYRNPRTFVQGNVVTLYVGRPTSVPQSTDRIILGTGGFGSDEQNNRWRDCTIIIEARSF